MTSALIPQDPILFGIVNITEDSFSDGGKYLETSSAIAHADALARAGAGVLDLGAAASNVDSMPVPTEVEINRLTPVVAALHEKGLQVSIDTFSGEVQRWAIARRVEYLNDIQGFPDEALYPELADSDVKLIVMHSVQGRGKATKEAVSPAEIYDRLIAFFETRLGAMEKAGVARGRMILDPGMGFFLSSDAETSMEVLRRLPELKAYFGLPALIGVSRKSFLRRITGRPTAEIGSATLACELFAAAQGADFIRTHDAGALADGLKIWQAAQSRGS